MIREAVSCSVIPMLIGDNKISHRLARRLFWRYSVRSHVFDRQCSCALRLMLSASFSPLPVTDDDEFILMTLERFARERDGFTYLLVPCSKSSKAFIDRNRAALGTGFIIRSPGELITSMRSKLSSPFSVMPKRKD